MYKKFTLITIIPTVFLVSTFAHATTSPVLIDAACKITCVTGQTHIPSDQGTPTTREETTTLYADFKGLTREQIDRQSDQTQRCKKTIAETATFKAIDCLYFKHTSTEN